MSSCVNDSAHRRPEGQVGDNQKGHDDQQSADVDALTVCNDQRGDGSSAEIVHRYPGELRPPDSPRRAILVKRDSKRDQPRIEKEVQSWKESERTKQDR